MREAPVLSSLVDGSLCLQVFPGLQDASVGFSLQINQPSRGQGGAPAVESRPGCPSFLQRVPVFLPFPPSPPTASSDSTEESSLQA